MVKRKKHNVLKKEVPSKTENSWTRIFSKQIEKTKDQKESPSYLSNGLFLLFVCLCFFFLFQVKTHIVGGISMFPTLEDGDRMLILKRSKPKRHSIITLVPLEKPKESYIKRVVGVPGDQIRLDGNSLFISQIAFKKDFVFSDGVLNQWANGVMKVSVEEPVALELQGESEIPENSYFVLGDNRNHSNDSRAFGLITEKQIEGTAFYRYYPFTRFGKLD